MNNKHTFNTLLFFYRLIVHRFFQLAVVILTAGISACNLNMGFDQDSNLAPVANAGADQNVKQGSTVKLEGGASFDPERNPLTFHWHLTEKPSGSVSTIVNPNDIKTSFVADIPGTFVVQLMVNDGISNSNPDSVTIGVVSDQPTIDRQLKFISTPIETTVAGQVYLYNSDAVDQDGNTLSYNLLNSPMNASINSATGEIFWLPTIAGSFTFEIQAINNFGSSATQAWQLLVLADPDNIKNNVLVPDLTGLKLDSATSTLNTVGLNLGEITWQSDSSVAKGYVISQNPAAATVINQSTKINLAVSLGEDKNLAPTANAGVDLNAAGNQRITLSASASVDPDGTITNYSWHQIIGRKVTLESSNTSLANFTSPEVNFDELLIFELTITDNDSASSTAQVRVTLQANKSIYLIVDETTKNQLSNELEIFSADIGTSNSGSIVIMAAPDTPTELRQILRDGYENFGLRGVFLIGDVPLVRQQSTRDSTIRNLSDHFYRALYCPYKLTADHSVVLFEGKETVISSCLPDIWLSRIKASRPADSINQIKTYLQKNHQLRNAPDQWQPGLFLMDAQGKDTIPDFKSMADTVFTQNPLYSRDQIAISQYASAATQKQTFLNALATPYEMLAINIHGATTAISFNDKTTDALLDSAELSSVPTQPRYIEMVSCSTGAFDTDNYLAGELLFNGTTQLVQASTTVFGFFTSEYQKSLNRKSRAFASGKSLAQLYKYLYDGEPMHYFGDPTISFGNRISIQNKASMALENHKYLEPFSYRLRIDTDATLTKTSSTIQISNTGSAALVLEGNDIANYVTVTPDTLIDGTNGFIFSLVENDQPLDFAFQIRIEPGETKFLSIEFNPQAATDAAFYAPGTEFTGLFPISTNDPDAPVFNLEVTGKIN